MKSMPRVGTFLKGVLSYHTTHPTEKDVERSKKQAKVGTSKRPISSVCLLSIIFFQCERVTFTLWDKRSKVEALINIR